MNGYITIAINAVFTGIGTAIGLYGFENIIKPFLERYKKHKQKLHRIVTTIKKIYDE